MEKIETSLDSGRVVTFGLSKELHDMVVKNFVKAGNLSYGNYTLYAPDTYMIEGWIEDADIEGNDEYVDIMQNALENDVKIYTLNDILGDASQELGEVIVYDAEPVPEKKKRKRIWALSVKNEDDENQAICVIPDEKFGTDELIEYLKEKLQNYVAFSYEEDKDHPDFDTMKLEYEQMIEDAADGYETNYSDYTIFFKKIDIV